MGSYASGAVPALPEVKAGFSMGGTAQ